MRIEIVAEVKDSSGNYLGRIIKEKPKRSKIVPQSYMEIINLNGGKTKKIPISTPRSYGSLFEYNERDHGLHDGRFSFKFTESGLEVKITETKTREFEISPGDDSRYEVIEYGPRGVIGRRSEIVSKRSYLIPTQDFPEKRSSWRKFWFGKN